MRKTLKLINHPSLLADNKQVVYVEDYINREIDLHCDLTNEDLAIIKAKNERFINAHTDECDEETIEAALDALNKAIDYSWLED